jgi:hypothetical protein
VSFEVLPRGGGGWLKITSGKLHSCVRRYRFVVKSSVPIGVSHENCMRVQLESDRGVERFRNTYLTSERISERY